MGSTSHIHRMRHIKQFPHCDSSVLHAPGKCKYCDMHPDWQELRVGWNINFTGEYDDDKSVCPSEIRRPLEKIERWYGNVPYPE